MRWFFKSKDGGPESNVTGYWLVESKQWGSIVLLRFTGPSREVFHTHAFNSVSWLLRGELCEMFRSGTVRTHLPSWKPFRTLRSYFHQVHSFRGNSWVLNFRGPWAKEWLEFDPNTGEEYTLKNGRVRG